MIRRYVAVSLVALVAAGSAMAAKTIVKTPIAVPGSTFNTETDMTNWKSTDPSLVIERDTTSPHEGAGCLKLYHTDTQNLFQVETKKSVDVSTSLALGDSVFMQGYFKTSSLAAQKKLFLQWQYSGTPSNPSIAVAFPTAANSASWTYFQAMSTCPPLPNSDPVRAANRAKFFFKIDSPDTLWLDSVGLYKLNLVTSASSLTAISKGTFQVSATGLVQFPAITHFTCALLQPNGRSVFSTSGTANMVILPLNTLSAGTYLLKTTTSDGAFEQKLQVR